MSEAPVKRKVGRPRTRPGPSRQEIEARRAREWTGRYSSKGHRITTTSQARRLKHGKYADVMSAKDIRKALLGKLDPERAERLENVFLAAVRTGELTPVNEAGTRAMMETELLRRASVQQVAEDGVVVQDHVLDREGKVTGIKLKAHPLIELIVKMAEQVGFTAEEMQLTAKALGQGQKDAAMTAMLERMAMLRSAPKGRMIAPARKLPPKEVGVLSE